MLYIYERFLNALDLLRSFPQGSTMDSKRLFTIVTLWLILSCILLDHAQGFHFLRKKAGKRVAKRRKGSRLSVVMAFFQVCAALKQRKYVVTTLTYAYIDYYI